MSYAATGAFTTKNDNTLPKDLSAALFEAESELLLEMILNNDELAKHGKENSGGGGPGSPGGGGGGTPRSGRKGGAPKRTVAGDFARSMTRLTAGLGGSACSYVRCVKPNASMRPGVYDPQYVVTQLRSLGLLQTCEVLKVGLPTRVGYAALRSQLEEAMPPAVADCYKERSDKDFAMAALSVFMVPRDAYHLGYTRLFFHAGR